MKQEKIAMSKRFDGVCAGEGRLSAVLMLGGVVGLC
jgi:hypothetical protein